MDSEAVGYFTNMAQHLIYLQPKNNKSIKKLLPNKTIFSRLR